MTHIRYCKMKLNSQQITSLSHSIANAIIPLLKKYILHKTLNAKPLKEMQLPYQIDNSVQVGRHGGHCLKAQVHSKHLCI